jgi:kynurenine formamidase
VQNPRWKYRPEGSNWGEFGADDRYGRINLITPELRLKAFQEVVTGTTFCLSLPLDRPGGMVLNDHRRAPEFHKVFRHGHLVFNLGMEKFDQRIIDVSCDEAVMLYSQYSTQWDALAHKGSQFDVDGSGVRKKVFYNGWSIVDENHQGTQGELGARNLSIANLAEKTVQGRGVMIDLYKHYGYERAYVNYEMLQEIFKKDHIVVEEGDMICLHTGLGELIMNSPPEGPDPSIKTACAVLDGADPKILQWITDSGLVAIASDNLAIEASSTLGIRHEIGDCGTMLPIHEHCLFKLGIHLGELWYLTELANYLNEHKRSRFLLTAPPLRLPGAAGSPVTPIATV